MVHSRVAVDRDAVNTSATSGMIGHDHGGVNDYTGTPVLTRTPGLSVAVRAVGDYAIWPEAPHTARTAHAPATHRRLQRRWLDDEGARYPCRARTRG